MKFGFFLLFFLLTFIGFTSAGELKDFELRSQGAFDRVSNNFSFSDVELRYDSVNDGSAEARRSLIGVYFIRLDYADLENATDFELEGMFAHELSHIEVYSKLAFVSLIFYGLEYQFVPKFRRSVERQADKIAIDHGFGKQLEAFRRYRIETSSERDRKILEKYYLTPDEIALTS